MCRHSRGAVGVSRQLPPEHHDQIRGSTTVTAHPAFPPLTRRDWRNAFTQVAASAAAGATSTDPKTKARLPQRPKGRTGRLATPAVE